MIYEDLSMNHLTTTPVGNPGPSILPRSVPDQVFGGKAGA